MSHRKSAFPKAPGHDKRVFLLDKMENVETAEEAIRHIELLFPPDSEYRDTSATGKSLLEEAKGNVGFSWRHYPEDVLIEFAKLCILEHNSQ